MNNFNLNCKFKVNLCEIILLRVDAPSVCNFYVRFAALNLPVSLMISNLNRYRINAVKYCENRSH